MSKFIAALVATVFATSAFAAVPAAHPNHPKGVALHKSAVHKKATKHKQHHVAKAHAAQHHG
ncbi:hypothetical protein IP91_02515 [Pseudoduganella lurida]|uniref:Acid-shock protein n=1 Tax=Pseudoduganella lurida TaxID=1036180 RepID=A0A562R7R0_9BURK|nr:hypothetical protein [Pseudoduganella lurida]TWI65109.1 hypothetical protein IP91_02515 [Pseudoduganella lurida]